MRTLLFSAIALLVPLAAEAAPICAADSLRLPANAVIAAEGDSLVYGFDPTETGRQAPINASPLLRSKAPFPETLNEDLSGKARVLNHGFPGDRSTEGLRRWAGEGRSDLTLIMFGTNDFGNFGKYPSGTLTPEDFRANLVRLAERRIRQGSQVVLMTPPPLQNPESDERLEAYRNVTRDVAATLGVRMMETSDALKTVGPKWVDGLHLSVAANEALAAAVADLLCISER